MSIINTKKINFTVIDSDNTWNLFENLLYISLKFDQLKSSEVIFYNNW